MTDRRDLMLRRMELVDLALVDAWLHDPDVAQWYLAGSTIEDQVEDLRRCVLGDEPTEALVVADGNEPIGWCQWYLCRDYPQHAKGVEAGPDDVGIDYAIGDRTRRAHGSGSALVGALVAYVRRRHAVGAVIADPEAANLASRKVLEKNGFQLLSVRPIDSEPTDSPMAIYRLSPQPDVIDLNVRRATKDDAAAIGQLLHEFNEEFDEPTPGPAFLAKRVNDLLATGDTSILLGGRNPDGLALLRFRPALWGDALECNLAELYVVRARRGHGLGRSLVEAAILHAGEQRAGHIEVATNEQNVEARALYESLGFTKGDGRSTDYFYQRTLL
jgi:RimJ/RimL family protein N-acetyltransferase